MRFADPILILDCNYVGHRAFHAHTDLEYEGEPVGVIFGFFLTMLKVSRTFKTNQFVFCWDSRKKIRRLQYPPYKTNKRDIPGIEEAYKQFNLLRTDLLPRIGFRNIVLQVGLEADDTIAEIVISNAENNKVPHRMIIVAGDEDLYQLLNFAPMYKLGDRLTYSKHEFRKEFGITPEDWAQVKALAGCPSDTVEGIKGVGPKRAINYILGKLNKTSKAYFAIKEGQDILRRNLDLVMLPHECTKPVVLHDDELDPGEFGVICSELGFDSFLTKRSDEWERFFKGNFI